jgi:hypothetical protein
MGIAETIIILTIWIVLGMIFFGTLVKNDEYDKMSEGALAFTFLMFLPTTIVLLLLIMIMETFEFIKEKITNGKG